MTIHELTVAECEAFLGNATVGRLGCAHRNQPYIVPVSVYFSRDEKCVYGFSTVGQKIEWMRENPNVCLEVDLISDQREWTTVLAVGRYEELGDSHRAERQRALELFQGHPRWWLPAGARLVSGGEHASRVIYRIHISSISGRKAVRPPSAIS